GARPDPLQTDFQKALCLAHPDTPCGYGLESECPTGDTCAARSGSGVCEVTGTSCDNDYQCPRNSHGIARRCMTKKTGKCQYVPILPCNVDAQCPSSYHC